MIRRPVPAGLDGGSRKDRTEVTCSRLLNLASNYFDLYSSAHSASRVLQASPRLLRSISQTSFLPNFAMPFSKAQINARLALQYRSSPRGRRAVTAPNEALSYRYESQQFFSLDVSTFTDLFASLTGQQLSRVAKAPEVIEARSDSRSTFDDF